MMMRGQIWKAEVPDSEGPKMWLVVSHNARNRSFQSVLAARITTTNKWDRLPTVVPVSEGECVHGWVTCDSLTEVWDEDLVDDKPIGSMSPRFMSELQSGLLATLGY